MIIAKQDRVVREYTLTMDYNEVHELYHFMLDLKNEGSFAVDPDHTVPAFYLALRDHA